MSKEERTAQLKGLIDLARQSVRQCPAVSDWSKIPENRALSSALAKGGFPNLSQAVLRGRVWAWAILMQRPTRVDFEWLEEAASPASRSKHEPEQLLSETK